MKHRSSALALLTAGLLAVALGLPVTSQAQPVPAKPRRPDPAGRALDRLRADAGSAVRVHRDAGGVDLVRAADGNTLVAAPAGTSRRPLAAARGYAQRYGPAFHLDGEASTVQDLTSVPAATGGDVVRAEQQVDGLPVFGGQLVMSLDAHGGLLSLGGATTSATSAAPATVSVERARRTALALTATAHRLPEGALRATDGGEWLYDPALVGVSDPLGPRPVWRFEVTDGYSVRELVLVDASSGAAALHFDEAEQLNRVVCNDANLRQARVPACSTPARTESTGATGDTEVDEAFGNVGEASDFYQQVGGFDLGGLIGTGTHGPGTLESWVRWCDSDSQEECPLQNAAWDGSHMVFGEGYAGADDVVAHELTHGVIDHTSQLFYFHQSGAINESLADVIGELVDQRNARPGEDDSGWTIAEDVPGGPIRSLKDPVRFKQPDAMRSPWYANDSVLADNGDIHANSGVGNKAAYLISQGGTLNGVTVAGIDAGDPSLTKTATLYVEVLKRLTSGATYADLGRTLESTCDELAAAGTAGFAGADCDSVRGAVAATQLELPPATAGAAAPQVPAACPRGATKVSLFHDDDGLGARWDRGRLWHRAPDDALQIAGNASSGTQSWFGFDPDPAFNDPRSSSLSPTTAVKIPAGQKTYLRFQHAYVFEWYPATRTDPAFYPDGGTVQLYTRSGRRWRLDTTRLTWVNGPDKRLTTDGTRWRGFRGDSHGYGSSRVDLSPLAGHRVRPRWTVIGDRLTPSAWYDATYLGWYVDNIEIYTCPRATHLAATVPTRVRAGSHLRVHGRLTRAGASTGVGHRTVRLQRRSLHGATWTTVASARTRSDGRFSTRVTVPRAAYYRLVSPRSAGWLRSATAAVLVRTS